MDPWIVEISRGQCVESSSLGHGVVVNADGEIILSFGDLKRKTFPRSAAKWIQALELIMSGAADALGLSDEHLAIACASHNGEHEHVSLVNQWLTKLKLDEDDLECGVALPFTEPVRLKLSHDHVTATQLHHCCSGKHTGMLSVCHHVGWQTTGYTAYDHPLQARIREHMSVIFGLDANTLDYASDGCSVPTYALPLDVLALGFAKLSAGRFSDKMNVAALRLRQAQAIAPFMVAGSERLDTSLLEAGQGRLQVKMGAEGVYLGAIADREIGFALKCEDGSLRGQEALVVELLRAVGEEDLVNRLPRNAIQPVIATARGEAVGQISVLRSS
ncbi:MAG: asparaginase [Pseudomonadota bacterium]|nr:asparaginase [Pseudomonadota bacterium]